MNIDQNVQVAYKKKKESFSTLFLLKFIIKFYIYLFFILSITE